MSGLTALRTGGRPRSRRRRDGLGRDVAMTALAEVRFAGPHLRFLLCTSGKFLKVGVVNANRCSFSKST